MFYREMWLALCILLNIHIAYSAVLPADNSPRISISVVTSGVLNDTHSDGVSFKITWHHIRNYENQEFIGFHGSPSDTNRRRIFNYQPQNISGSAILTVETERNFLGELPTELQDQKSCYDYWVEIHRNGRPEHTSCLKISPHWMQEAHQSIDTRKMNEIVLPGQGFSSGVSLVKGRLSSWPQLVFGSRYLEIDVRHEEENSTNEFYLQRGDYKTKLSDYMKDICAFVEQTKELVLLEITVIPYSVIFEENYSYYDLQMDLFGSCQRHILSKKEAGAISFEDMIVSDRRLVYILNLPTDSRIFWKSPRAIDYTYMKENALSNQIEKDLYLYRKKGLLYKIFPGTSSFNEEGISGDTMIRELKGSVSSLLNIVVTDEPFNPELMDFVLLENGRQQNKQSRLTTPGISKEKSLKQAKQTEIKGVANIKVWPTIRATPYDGLYRLIKINWDVGELLQGDIVAIFQDIPQSSSSSELNFTIPNQSPEEEIPSESLLLEAEELYPKEASGFKYSGKLPHPLFVARPLTPRGMILTNLQHPRETADQMSKGGCTGVWAAFIRKEKIEAARCISSHPNWMWDNRSKLANRSLRSLVVPGSHNSGMFSLYDSSNLIQVWFLCQDQTILSQLLLGIRYLDLRIGYYPDTKELLWINHDQIKWIPLQNVLEDIRAFASISKDPIIVDVHRTPVGFDYPEAPHLLISALNDTLSDFFIPAQVGQNVTLNRIWRLQKNVIISYGSHGMRENFPWLWQPIFQAWPNTKSLAQMETYLNQYIMDNKQSSYIWAAMGHLTGTIWDAFLDPKGIRGLADKAGPTISRLLESKWKNRTNILATDFFRVNDVIDNAIKINTEIAYDESKASYRLSKRIIYAP